MWIGDAFAQHPIMFGVLALFLAVLVAAAALVGVDALMGGL